MTDYDEDDFGCPGHESLDGAHMGEAVYCDGSCRPPKLTPTERARGRESAGRLFAQSTAERNRFAF